MAARSFLASLFAFATLPALFGATGCGGDAAPNGTGETPAHLAGNYSVTLLNRDNTCPVLMDEIPWMEGATSSGVPFSVTQSGVKITGEAMGPAAISFLVLTGENEFKGEIHEAHFAMTNRGSKTTVAGDCSYTINVTVEGDLNGDTIEGTVTYAPVFAANADCTPDDCRALQEFNGTRPPSG